MHKHVHFFILSNIKKQQRKNVVDFSINLKYCVWEDLNTFLNVSSKILTKFFDCFGCFLFNSNNLLKKFLFKITANFITHFFHSKIKIPKI